MCARACVCTCVNACEYSDEVSLIALCAITYSHLWTRSRLLGSCVCVCVCVRWGCSVIDHSLRDDILTQAHPHRHTHLLIQPLNPTLTRSLSHAQLGANAPSSMLALALIALATTAFMFIYSRHRRGFGRKSWGTKSNRYAAIPELFPDMGRCTQSEVQPGVWPPGEQAQFAHLNI